MTYYKIFLSLGGVIRLESVPGNMKVMVNKGIGHCFLTLSKHTTIKETISIHVRPIRFTDTDLKLETDNDEFIQEFKGKGIFIWFDFEKRVLYATSYLLAKRAVQVTSFVKSLLKKAPPRNQSLFEKLVTTDPFVLKAHLN